MSLDEAREAFYAALAEDDADELYERAPCGYLSTTPDGTIIKVNATFLALTGYSRDELVGRTTFAQLLTTGGRIYHETHYAPMLQMQGTAREIALEIVRSDRSRLPVLVNSVLERDRAGTPLVVRTAVFDATERREYERELLRAKERAEESETRARVLAETLQHTLIPPAPPEVPGLEIAAVYRPAGSGAEVGGDFYDVFELGPDDCIATAGDVQGKGVEAAVVTAATRYALRGAAVRHSEPSEMLTAVNDVLRRGDTDRFCTLVVMRLRRLDGSWMATICAAGHALPLLARVDRPPESVGRPGTLLGAFDEPVLHDLTVVLQPEDEIVLYTDGVTEGRRGSELFGEERLFASVSAHRGSASGLTHGILDEVLEFQSGYARDDIVIMTVRIPED